MAKLSELQSKVTGSAINVDPLGKKRPTTQTVFNTLQQSVSQSAAPSPRISKTTAPSSLPESKGKKVTLPTVKQKTNPLTTPAKSGFFEGLSILPSSADELISPYAWGRAGTALLGAAEGVADFIGSGFYKGVQGISSLGGLAPNPVSEWAGRNADAFLDNSITQDLEQKLAEKYNPSQGAQNVTGIGQAIVQMLPGIGASKVVSAAGKGLNAAQALSRGENVGRALFGIQAAGNAASQAKAEGADTGRALAFGAASGALETAIEGIAGGIPGLGGGKVGKIAEAVKASPLVSRALDIAGEGGEEALSTVLTPYLQRAIYDPDAPNATPEEIAQSAIMGAVAAGVLQGGLELPGAISNAASDIRTTRRAIGSNEDITQRATANIQAGQNMARYSSGNPLAVTLPTVEEAKSGLFLPGSPAYQQADNRMPGEQVIRAELPGAGQKNADVEPLVSIDNIRRYQSAIDGVFMGTLPTGADIVLGQTPSILAEYGAPALDLHMRQSVARKIAYPSGYMGGKHNLGLSALKNLPYQLADPIAIIENPQSNSRGLASKIVLTEWNDLDGKPVIIPIHLNAQGAIDVQNDVASAFGADYIQRIIGNNGENVLYTKNNEDIYQLLSKGRPVPQAMADDVLARNSIPPAGQDVNLQQGDRGETQDTPREGPGPAFETGPESSVGAARKGFDPWSEFQGTKSEFFPEGANAARPVDVPTTDPQGRPIRKTASTSMGAKAIPDEAVGDIQNMVLRGELSYDRVSDRASIDRAVKTIEMKGYTDKNLRLPTDIQYAIGRASARIPGWDYQQVPYIDAWGREEKSGTLPMRAMDNFLNPAYTSSMQVTDVDKEIQRLYNQTGDGGVVPDRPQKYITVDGERVDLTGEQYVEYATKRGQTQFKLLEELLDSSLYRSLGDEEKTQAVSSVYNYADMLGKAAVSDYQPEDWVAEAQNAKKEFGISTSEYLLLRGQYGGSLLSGKKVREAYQAGMPAQDYLHWAVQEKDTDGSGRTNQAETIAAIETSGLSQEEKDVLYAVEQVSDAGRRKWERARDWGLSVEDYQRYYAIYSGDGKKEEKLTALQRAGMTAAQANYFWSLMSKN